MGRKVANFIPSTRSIVNKYSAGGTSYGNLNTDYYKLATSGALSADELYTALNLTGGGWVTFCAAYNNSGTPTHTIRLQITADNVTVFDAISDTITATANKRALIAIGDFSGATTVWQEGYPLRYNSSLVVKIASSAAGTDYVGLAYELQTTA